MTESTLQRSTVARALALFVAALCIGAVAFTIGGTSASALSANVSEPYPQTPGSTSNMTIATTAERGDAITEEGIERVRINLSGATFDGNVRGISASDVSMFINPPDEESGDPITAASVQNDTSSNTITATFDQTLSVAPGERIIVRVDGVRLPSGSGRHPLRVGFTTPNGSTDGPISNPYRLVTPELNFSDQVVEQDEDSQIVRITAVNPDLGYIGIYDTNPQGDPQNLVGFTTASPSYARESYTVDVSIEEGQQLKAVLYYETTGTTLDEREAANFSRDGDSRVLDNGQSVTAAAFVDINRPAERIDTGEEYTAGDTLLFARGEPDTDYFLSAVENGRANEEVREFRTNSTGVATIDTENLSTSKYAIVTSRGRNVVSLDGDDVTNPSDDSVLINNPEQNEERREGFNESNQSGQQEGASSDGGMSLSFLFFISVLLFAGVGVTAYFIQLRRMDI